MHEMEKTIEVTETEYDESGRVVKVTTTVTFSKALGKPKSED